jgi:two-component system chemotaxis response regulator CheB
MSVNNNRQVNVLVVDDSAFMRKVVVDILRNDDEIKVIGTAMDGKEAIAKFKKLKPDIITMDVEMPVMDGLVSIKEILKIEYVPILVISSHTKTGTDYTIEALENGAVDFISKPENIIEMKNHSIKNELLEKVKLFSKVQKELELKKTSKENKINKIIKKDIASKIKPAIVKLDNRNIEKIERNRNINRMTNIIAIGTSTGGPKALQTVISKLPKNLNAVILIVQHMPAGFTKSLAERLDRCSNIEVKEAEDREILEEGKAYIAPGDFHMVIENHIHDLKIKLTKDPPIGKLRPAVDVMFQSLSDTGLKNISAIIMTGMGADGSEGVKKLKELNGAYTIAQDESSSTVFGMPKMAIQTGAVDKIVTLDKISEEIIKIAGGDI